VIIIAAASIGACASSGGRSISGDAADAPADAERKTQQQVQSELMAFADRFFAETLEAANALELTLETPEGRYTAAGARLLGLIVTADIAASPNPGAAVLDMCVYVSLKRMAWQEYWMPEVYGDAAGQPILDAYRGLEHDIWGIASEIYTPEQLDELRALIDSWRAQHPHTVSVDFVRLAELGDSRRVQSLIDAGRPGGLLAPIQEANRNIEEMRLLAERLAFLATRMQIMVSLQVDLAFAKLAAQPEVRQLLDDSRTFAGVSDRAAEAFATLVADLPEERRAAIDQILAGLSDERERIFADLGDEDGQLRPALGDMQDTLEIGHRLAEMLNETVVSADRLVARMLEREPARKFDILDYQATLAEATVTVREIQTTLTSIEHVLDSAADEEHLNPIVEGANRLQDEVVNEIIDRAFVRGVALIIVFFAVLALYRWLIPRLAPDRAAPGQPRS
jgi:hypothetical protein